MKVTFVDELETRTAYSHKMYCSNCGNRYYYIIHQLEPEEIDCWWIKCIHCGYTSPQSPTRDIAIARWKQNEYD